MYTRLRTDNKCTRFLLSSLPIEGMATEQPNTSRTAPHVFSWEAMTSNTTTQHHRRTEGDTGKHTSTTSTTISTSEIQYPLPPMASNESRPHCRMQSSDVKAEETRTSVSGATGRACENTRRVRRCRQEGHETLSYPDLITAECVCCIRVTDMFGLFGDS